VFVDLIALVIWIVGAVRPRETDMSWEAIAERVDPIPWRRREGGGARANEDGGAVYQPLPAAAPLRRASASPPRRPPGQPGPVASPKPITRHRSESPPVAGSVRPSLLGRARPDAALVCANCGARATVDGDQLECAAGCVRPRFMPAVEPGAHDSGEHDFDAVPLSSTELSDAIAALAKEHPHGSFDTA
jgi:hypothetical protein